MTKYVRTGGKQSVEVYHNTRCKAVKEGQMRSIDSDEIEHRDLTLCQMCSGEQRENRNQTQGDYSYYRALKEHSND